MITVAILLLFALFWAAEAVAHFTGYRYGVTLSKLIWDAERRYPVGVRILVGAALAVLTTHLELGRP